MIDGKGFGAADWFYLEFLGHFRLRWTPTGCFHRRSWPTSYRNHCRGKKQSNGHKWKCYKALWLERFRVVGCLHEIRSEVMNKSAKSQAVLPRRGHVGHIDAIISGGHLTTPINIQFEYIFLQNLYYYYFLPGFQRLHSAFLSHFYFFFFSAVRGPTGAGVCRAFRSNAVKDLFGDIMRGVLRLLLYRELLRRFRFYKRKRNRE